MLRLCNQMRRFSSVNLSSVTRASVLESKDHDWVGQYVKSVAQAPESQA